MYTNVLISGVREMWQPPDQPEGKASLPAMYKSVNMFKSYCIYSEAERVEIIVSDTDSGVLLGREAAAATLSVVMECLSTNT